MLGPGKGNLEVTVTMNLSKKALYINKHLGKAANSSGAACPGRQGG